MSRLRLRRPRPSRPTTRPRRWVALAIAVLLAWPAALLYRRFVMGASFDRSRGPSTAAPYASWPWRDVQPEVLRPGVTHWLALAGDGTSVELFDFDFGANPRLRLELYDQDEDDARPFDDVVNYWPRGVDSIVRHLAPRGTIVAAWNGPFFGYRGKGLFGRGTAHHVGPVVLSGKLHDYGANHRWTLGLRCKNGRLAFETLHQPPVGALQRFDYAAGGLQCLIRNGHPLKLQPFPAPGAVPLPQPVPSTPGEAGHIPLFDHMKTSRTSLAWSRDGRHLYLLFVREPDAEFISGQALRHNIPLQGGWTVADVQRFWLAYGVSGAVNSDGGDVAQLMYRNLNASYTLVPSRKVDVAMRRQLSPHSRPLGAGGSLLYFYIVERV